MSNGATNGAMSNGATSGAIPDGAKSGAPVTGGMTPRRGQDGPAADPAPLIGWCDHPGGWVRWGRWDPAGPVRAICLLLPGRTEYIEKYDFVAAALTARGHAVVALDWYGQGLSARPLADPDRHHVPDWTEQGRDLDRVVRAAGLDRAGVPVWVLAHSMGAAALFARLLADDPVPVRLEEAVLTAPLLGLHGMAGTGRRRLTGAMLSTGAKLGLAERWAPSQGPRNPVLAARFEDNPLTHDGARFARLIRDMDRHPALAIGGVTWGWLAGLFALFRKLDRGGYGRIALPVTVIAGGDETVVSNTDIEAAAQAMPDATVLTVPGARHEILMETADRAQLAWDTLFTVADRVAAPTKGEAS